MQKYQVKILKGIFKKVACICYHETTLDNLEELQTARADVTHKRGQMLFYF